MGTWVDGIALLLPVALIWWRKVLTFQIPLKWTQEGTGSTSTGNALRCHCECQLLFLVTIGGSSDGFSGSVSLAAVAELFLVVHDHFYQPITYCIIINCEIQAVWLSLQQRSSAGINPLLFLTLWQLVWLKMNHGNSALSLVFLTEVSNVPLFPPLVAEEIKAPRNQMTQLRSRDQERTHTVFPAGSFCSNCILRDMFYGFSNDSSQICWDYRQLSVLGISLELQTVPVCRFWLG